MDGDNERTGADSTTPSDNERPGDDSTAPNPRPSRKREKKREYARQNARSALIEANGVAVKRCNACVVSSPRGIGFLLTSQDGNANSCLVWLDEPLPRKGALYKCSACVRGSGRRCSHSDLIHEINNFRRDGDGRRTDEFSAFFRKRPLDEWGPQIGLSQLQIEELAKRDFLRGMGQHMVNSLRYQAVPKTILDSASRDDPKGESVSNVTLSPPRQRIAPAARKRICVESESESPSANESDEETPEGGEA